MICIVIIFVMIYGIHIINERRQDFSPSAYRYDIELPDSPKESPDGTKRLIVGIAFDTLPGGLVHCMEVSVMWLLVRKELFIRITATFIIMRKR